MGYVISLLSRSKCVSKGRDGRRRPGDTKSPAAASCKLVPKEQSPCPRVQCGPPKRTDAQPTPHVPQDASFAPPPTRPHDSSVGLKSLEQDHHEAYPSRVVCLANGSRVTLLLTLEAGSPILVREAGEGGSLASAGSRGEAAYSQNAYPNQTCFSTLTHTHYPASHPSTSPQHLVTIHQLSNSIQNIHLQHFWYSL